MKTAVIISLVVGLLSFSEAQLCARKPDAGFCRAPSSSVMQELNSAVSYAYNNIMDDVVVNSQYSGSNTKSCGGTSCTVIGSASRARAKTMKPAQAFAGVARDMPEWYLSSVGAGCPSAKLLESYTTVLFRWVDRDGFLGKVSPQGVLEVDWKIITVSSGYMKMRQYLAGGARNKIEGWISKLYDVSNGRQADYSDNEGNVPNNHYIWHHVALMYAGAALGSDSKVQQHMSAITDHMQQYITTDGVITSEARCTMTMHYHYFYMEAALGAVAGYKYYTGSLPGAWGSLSARVAAVMNNINNHGQGVARMSKKFGYPGTLRKCRPSQIKKVDAGNLKRTNAIYKTVVAARGALAPCDADSSYYGRFRFLPYMWSGAPKPALGTVCCPPA